MNLRKRRSLQNYAPMVDVVFLLLLFFMLSSQLGKQSTIAFAPNFAGEGEAPLLLEIGDELRVDGAPIKRNDLEKLFQSHAQKNLAIRADEGVSFGKVVEISDLARAQGIASIVIVENKP